VRTAKRQSDITLGAEHVSACEADPLVCAAASEIVARNGFAHAATLDEGGAVILCINL
jgi:hypothetical protein